MRGNRWQNVSFHVAESVCDEFMLSLFMCSSLHILIIFILKKNKTTTGFAISHVVRVRCYIFVLGKAVPAFPKRHWN